MRGSNVQGRFTIPFESHSIDEGMVDELRSPVGAVVNWWVWDQAHLDAAPADVVSSIYDTSNPTPGLGRVWKTPFEMPVIMAQQLRGTNVMNERGFYVVDSLRLVIAVADVARLLPSMVQDPSVHIKDRVVFQNDVFTPTRVLPRGRYADNYAVITLDCTMVNAEELQNDPQFLDYAN